MNADGRVRRELERAGFLENPEVGAALARVTHRVLTAFRGRATAALGVPVLARLSGVDADALEWAYLPVLAGGDTFDVHAGAAGTLVRLRDPGTLESRLALFDEAFGVQRPR